MAHTQSAPLAPVLPCIAFNQSSCFSESCNFSHLPDSFSLGSGGRNVCLLYLMSRCDGWGCSYSHVRDELAWTDDEVKILVHAHMHLIDAYNGRIARNPPSFHPFASSVSHPVPWAHVVASQAYLTPSSSIAINPTGLGSEQLVEPYLARQASWSPDIAQRQENDSLQPAPLDVASEPGHDHSENMPHDISIDTEYAITLNPLAAPFVPSGYIAAPDEELPAITPMPESGIHLLPEESTVSQLPSVSVLPEIQDKVNAHETPEWGREKPKEPKIATKADIASWDPAPSTGLTWDDTPADAWATNSGSKGGGGWDAGPGEDAFKTPLTVIWPGPARKPREPFKAKEKSAKSWRDRNLSEPQAASTSQKGKPTSKKSAKFDSSSSRQHERRQSMPSSTPSKSNDKSRSLITVHTETTAFGESWRERGPHQIPEVKDEDRAKSYRIKVQPGSMIPSKKVTTEIAKAHLQLARSQPGFNSTAAEEEGSAVDPGIKWVNGGPSRLHAAPDPPREFSQRSRLPGSTWGPEHWPQLNEKASESAEY